MLELKILNLAKLESLKLELARFEMVKIRIGKD